MADNRRPYGDTPDYSDISSGAGSTLIGASSPPAPRPAYGRMASSAQSTDEPNYATIHEGDVGGDMAERFRNAPDSQGLGIGTGSPPKKQIRRVSIAQAPLGASYNPMSPQTPGSADPLISSFKHARTISSTSNTQYDPTLAYGLGGDDIRTNRYSRPSANSSFNSTLEPSHSDTEPLRKIPTESIRSGKSGKSAYDGDFHPNHCISKRSFYQGRANWLAICIILLAIFSTVFSGIYLGIALRAPRWGRTISHNSGSITAATANILTQLFAKLIELSFVTVFVAFLGQVLSRRAFSRDSRGVTLAELSMRNWVMQPGSVLTHYESVQFAALTFLGAVSLTAAIMAMLYTTAASALVTPILKFGPWEEKMMHGLVKTSFANPVYLAQQCQTPIQTSEWNTNYSPTVVGNTCLELEHAAEGFHNYQRYLSRWAAMAQQGQGSTDFSLRPPGFALYQENTTVNATWINFMDTKTVSQKYNRIINNVTLAMPHSGVFQAARDPLSDIMQPEELDGIGIYNIRASLPSPYLNVLCANVKKDEIKDLVYEAQLNATTQLNATADLPNVFTNNFNWTHFSSVKTPIDDVFGWDDTNRPPIFYKYPLNFNTLLNDTAMWGRSEIYLLGLGSPDMKDEYILCGAKVGLTSQCTTEYTATGNGGTMTAHCNDPNDKMAFVKGNSSRGDTVSLDWFNVGTTALLSLSLNNGVVDGDASNARILTELILQENELNPALPSPAEAIAVMAGCTLLMSAEGSPFDLFWNYTTPMLSSGVHQMFNATIRAQQYASGGNLGYQRGFYIVLFAVFMTNLFCLIYLLMNKGLVTDFSEPPNIFSLAINSPPAKVMGGSCGGGPEGEQYTVKWGVEMEGDGHLFIADKPRSIYKTGARAESRMSFADLLKRRKWRQVDDTESRDNIELGGKNTAYSGAGAVDDDEDMPKPKRSQGTQDSGLTRLYSKIAKRTSVL